MEWQGINLTNYHQRIWLDKLKKLTIQYSLVSVIVVMFFILLMRYKQTLNQELINIQHKNQFVTKQVTQKQRQLALFYRQQNLKKNTIKPENMLFILQYLEKLPITGIVTELSVKHKSNDYFTILGKLNNQNDFKQVTNYFENLSNYDSSIDMIQINSNNQLEFIFSLKKVEK